MGVLLDCFWWNGVGAVLLIIEEQVTDTLIMMARTGKNSNRTPVIGN